MGISWWGIQNLLDVVKRKWVEKIATRSTECHHATAVTNGSTTCLPRRPPHRRAQRGPLIQLPASSHCLTQQVEYQSPQQCCAPYSPLPAHPMRSAQFLVLLSSGKDSYIILLCVFSGPFYRFAGFLLSCVGISFAAARGRGIKGGAALLGVV
jgi:hypothetical protein